MRPRRSGRIGMRHAARGLRWAWSGQRNLKIEGVAGGVAVLLAVWLQAPLVPVLLACGLVLCTEAMNTAVEATVDLVRPEQDPQAGRAKDVAASAVLLAAGTSVAVGVLVLGPPLVARLTGGAA